jgi:glycosyltransferase involved in cell wall biosynthesis
MKEIHVLKLRVSFVGGEEVNTESGKALRQAQLCLPQSAIISDLDHADVIYSISPGALAHDTSAKLEGKIVVCEFDNPPNHCVTQDSFRKIQRMVSLWVAHTSQAKRQAEDLGLNVHLVPYRLDSSEFIAHETQGDSVAKLRQRYSIPPDRYVIGNFQNDSEGSKLSEPKLQKGPDVFIQIVIALFKKNLPVHVLIAGPRRHWLRSRLKALRIPYSFAGIEIQEDDINQNTLLLDELNNLYACLDLVLVTSRWDGGSYSVLEAAATQRKILSSRVGLAEDVLDTQSIFDSTDQAVEIIEQDISHNILDNTVRLQYEKYLMNHTPAPAKDALAGLFKKMIETPSFYNNQLNTNVKAPIRTTSKWTDSFYRISSRKQRDNQKSISMLREFHKPPYGGGNQFMLALKAEFEKMGICVLNNEINPYVDAYLFDSIWLDLKLLDKLAKFESPRVGHRIDGPIFRYRGKDKSLDDKIFEINREFASTSIIQSVYTLHSIRASGYSPVSPIIISNAVNPDIFYRQSRSHFFGEKIRIVSTSWSDNPMKGVADYKWMDENLDFKKYSYTFYGRVKEDFKNIVVHPPLPSNALADAIREHDVYITASRNDPCSNALIEAMACGLPALYKNSGGHPELVGFGGLPYDEVEQIPVQLSRLSKNYDLFAGCSNIRPMSEIAKQYLDALLT